MDDADAFVLLLIAVMVLLFAAAVGRMTLGDDAHPSPGYRLKCKGDYVAVEVAPDIILEGRECREVKK